MSGRFAASKFRLATGKIAKKELWYPDVQAAASISSEATTLAAGEKFLSVAWSSKGTLGLIPISLVGKRKGQLPLIHAHAGDVVDQAFDPFNPLMLATSSDDATIKLWKIPEDVSADLTTADLTLTGHTKRVDSIRYHPTAQGILASTSSDQTVRIWDLESGQAKSVLDAFGDVAYSCDWNFDGSLLATTCKDKQLRIFDPRAKNVAQEGAGHTAPKHSSCKWLSDWTRLLTAGFSSGRDRQIRMWDSRNLANSLSTTNIDSSTGPLSIMYDNESYLLFLLGKGDGVVRPYELLPEKPFVKPLNSVPHDMPAKGAALAHKRTLDVMDVEVARVYKLTANSIVPTIFSVPRKDRSVFHDDLFPDAPSGEPSLSASEWFGGETRAPKLSTMNPGTASSASSSSSGGASTSASSASSSSSEVEEEAKPSITVAESRAQRKSINIVRSSLYRHVFGKAWAPKWNIENVQVDTGVGNASLIRTNGKYISVPYRGAGGLIAILSVDEAGKRLPNDVATLELGSSVLDFDWSPFQEDLFVCSTESAHIKLFKVPPGGYKHAKAAYKDCSLDLIGHYQKVTTVNFHPAADNVIVSTSIDGTAKIWDLTTGKNVSTNDGFSDAPLGVTFNYDGSQIFVTCRDRKNRLIDPRTQKIVAEAEGHSGSKGSLATWLGNSPRVFTTGFSRSREYAVWDVRNLTSSLTTQQLDDGSGLQVPIYNEGTGVVFLAGKGDSAIKFVEVTSEAPYVYPLGTYQTQDPQSGLACLPITSCNVKKAEIARFLKLTSNTIQTIEFRVPRTRLEYFQDDIYPPARSSNPSMTAADWFSGKNKDPELVSLRPAGMEDLTSAPAVQSKAKYNFDDEARKRAAGGPVTRGEVFDKFYDQMKKHEEDLGVDGVPAPPPQELNEGVDDEEWDD